MSLEKYSGEFTRRELIHLLKRTMFGSKPADIDYFSDRTLESVVDELLTPGQLPDPPVKEYNSSRFNNPDTNINEGSTWVNDINLDNQVQQARNLSYKKWHVGQMLNQDRSIREKLTLFWLNHFGNQTEVIQFGNLTYKQNDLLRRNCLGNFKELIKKISLDPGMLIYLNGHYNSKTAPDENYSRELQELFTIGKDEGAGYTEEDVREAARVLTGWRIAAADLESYNHTPFHDIDDKHFSSFYGNKIIYGDNTPTGVMAELDELLDMIFDKNEVSRYIVRKLYRWFVYYEINDEIENEIIVPLSETFRNSGYEIIPVLKELFTSKHFYDVTLSQGAIIKSPVDFFIGAMREFDVQYPDTEDYDSTYTTWVVALSVLIMLTQNPHDPPDVAGWAAYYQEPGFHKIWINSDTLPTRNQITDLMVFLGFNVNNFNIIFDVIKFAKSLSDPSDPNKLIDESLEILYRIPLSDNVKKDIKEQILLSGQSQDYYWTSAWIAYENDPNQVNENLVKARLMLLYKRLMNLEEYQLS